MYSDQFLNFAASSWKIMLKFSSMNMDLKWKFCNGITLIKIHIP